MKYLIFVEKKGKYVGLCCDVAKSDAAYLQKKVIPKMKPLTDDEYLYGPSGIVRTPAKHSYVIDGNDVYWCIDWSPGLLVIRFSPDGSMAWGAMNRAKEGEDDFDDPRYNLVYRAWDAQFDEIEQEDWNTAPKALVDRHTKAMEHVGKLHERLESGFKTQKQIDAYFARCEKSPIWKGTEG